MAEKVERNCKACDEDCGTLFMCDYCNEKSTVCQHRIGGFHKKGEDICVTCYEERELAPRMLRDLRQLQHKYDQRNSHSSRGSSSPTSRGRTRKGTFKSSPFTKEESGASTSPSQS